VFSGGSFDTLDGIGTFLGYKRQWLTARDAEFGANVAYGYAEVERRNGVDADDNRQLQQAWANALYFPTKNVACGLEYQYGRRETYDGRAGEDNRLLFVLALTSAGEKAETKTIGMYNRPGEMESAAAVRSASRQRF
jgi:predicted porin